MTGLRYMPRDTRPRKINHMLHEDGALVLEGALPADELARLKSEVMPYVTATAPGGDGFSGRRTTRTGALAARSAAVRSLIMHKTTMPAARKFLKPWCEKIRLHLTQLIRIMPGQRSQALHRDREAWGAFLPDAMEPQFNCMWAITDFIADNGATRVAPGSNHWDKKRRAKPAEIVSAEMEAGSVLLYSGSVIHGGGGNNSDHDRLGLNVDYALAWLRQEENQYLSCPPHIARKFDPAFRAMLGYTPGSYVLGYFSPPTAPGLNPEVMPPEFWFDGMTDEPDEQTRA